MSIAVVLQTIQNEKLEVVDAPDALLDRLLPIDDPAFSLLQCVDEYGYDLQ